MRLDRGMEQGSQKYIWEPINNKSDISSQLEKVEFPGGTALSGKNKAGSLPLPLNKSLMYQIPIF